MKKTSDFAMIIHAFFTDWLGRQRELSTHTIRSYRDTWRLFLRFLEEHRSLPIERLALRDITIAHVLEFLEHHERTHSISTGTRNCRLAGLRALFDFAARQDPTAIARELPVRVLDAVFSPGPLGWRVRTGGRSRERGLVVPRHPVGGVRGDGGGVALEGDEIVERGDVI